MTEQRADEMNERGALVKCTAKKIKIGNIIDKKWLSEMKPIDGELTRKNVAYYTIRDGYTKQTVDVPASLLEVW